MTDARAPVIELLPHQVRALDCMVQFFLLVGGFGCGKSYGLGAKAHQLASVNYGHDGAIISRSHRQLKDFLLPEVEKYWQAAGASYKFKDGNKLLLTYGGTPSTVHLLSTENEAYKRWAGGNWSWALLDELDTMPKAAEVWSYTGDRVRVKAPLMQIGGFTTPEGYGFCYDFFDKRAREDASFVETEWGHRTNDLALIRGCTLDNPNVDWGYVKRQIQTRNPLALRAYIYGEFCNLEGSLVYHLYERSYDGNWTDKTLADFPDDMPLHIGCDFNKGINATVIHVVVNNTSYAVKELYGFTYFDEVINHVKEEYGHRKIWWYPDAQNVDNVQRLKNSFGAQNVIYTPGNPRVLKRVASLHNRILTADGERHYLVNPNTCQHLDHQLGNQPTNAKGEPDKDGGLDHAPDGAGYFAHHKFPYFQKRAPRVIPL